MIHGANNFVHNNRIGFLRITRVTSPVEECISAWVDMMQFHGITIICDFPAVYSTGIFGFEYELQEADDLQGTNMRRIPNSQTTPAPPSPPANIDPVLLLAITKRDITKRYVRFALRRPPGNSDPLLDHHFTVMVIQSGAVREGDIDNDSNEYAAP